MNNRHSRTVCFDLEFNEDTLQWANLGKHTNASSDEEELVFFIDNWLADEWSGTATQLVSALKDIDNKFIMNSAVVTKYLKKLAPKFKSYESIEVTFSRKSDQKTIHLKRT